MVWKYITTCLFIPCSFAMEGLGDPQEENLPSPHPIIQNYRPSEACLKQPKRHEIENFKEWLIKSYSEITCKKARISSETLSLTPSFRSSLSRIEGFLSLYEIPEGFKNPRKIFNERVLKTNLNNFINFVVVFHGIWEAILEDFIPKADRAFLGKEIFYFYENCDPKLKEEFGLFQRLNNLFLHHYNIYFDKCLPSMGALPEMSNELSVYMVYFTDAHGYLPFPLKNSEPTFFQPLLYGQDMYINGIGHRGFIPNGNYGIVQQKGILIENKASNSYLDVYYYRGKDESFPYQSLCKTITYLPEADPQDKIIVIPSEFYQNLLKLLDKEKEGSFIPFPENNVEEEFCNYLFIESLKESLTEETPSPLLLTTAAWVIQQTGQEAAASKEELIEQLSKLQEDLEDTLSRHYEEEIRAEQEAVMKQHTYDVYKHPQRKKSQGRSKNHSRPAKPKAVTQQPANHEEVKRKATLYFKENLQKARVTYKDLCKMTHKMIRNVFEDHEEIFSKTITGSHVNIHIEGSEGVTLVKKHGGGRKDLTYPASFAKNYMSKLLMLGINALENSRT